MGFRDPVQVARLAGSKRLHWLSLLRALLARNFPQPGRGFWQFHLVWNTNIVSCLRRREPPLKGQLHDIYKQTVTSECSNWLRGKAEEKQSVIKPNRRNPRPKSRPPPARNWVFSEYLVAGEEWAATGYPIHTVWGGINQGGLESWWSTPATPRATFHAELGSAPLDATSGYCIREAGVGAAAEPASSKGEAPVWGARVPLAPLFPAVLNGRDPFGAT